MVNQDEIHRMAHSEDVEERREAAEQLCHNFADLPDKEQSWSDFLHLSKDTNVIWTEPNALVSAFLQVPDKDKAWNDIIACTDKSNNINTRIGFSFALGSAFPHIIDKGKAWEVLIGLIDDDNSNVRWRAAESLAPAFLHMLDKEKASKDILFLSKKKDKIVLSGVAEALGSVFSYVTNKDEIWNVLLNLSRDIDGFVRISATYSLGQISIFKATIAKSENKFHEELENAIEFFENSLLEGVFNNPAEFCLPFYRSFHAITSGKKDKEADVDKYLKEAKSAVEGSNSREKLLEAIENLSNALTEAQKARSIGELQGDLTAYSRYCNRAADLLCETEGHAPGAVKLIRRGLPIIDERIKDILAEIRQKSEALCRKTKGTPYEDVGKDIYHIGQGFPNIRDGIGLEKSVENYSLY